MEGWTGKTLVIDLSKMEIRVESLEDDIYNRFIGGTGINAWLLWKEVPPETNSFSPENPLILGFGPLSGTQTPCGNRFTVTFKSPLTGIYGDTNVGGSFGPEVKFAGYDSIIIRGRAEKPVYLWINNENVEIRDASHLWGKNIRETEDLIREELGDQKVKTLCIGPAGENLVKYAVLVATGSRVAGRCGSGCLAGLKNLKAIAVRGTKEVRVRDPGFLRESFNKARNLVKLPDNVFAENRRRFGTLAALAPYSTHLAAASTRNFRDTVYEKYKDIDGEALEAKYKTGNRSCFKWCPIGCEQAWKIKDGRFAGEVGERLELVTAMAFGMVVDNNDLASICYLQNLTTSLGIDAPELGVTIAMAMECWEKGLLTDMDTDGIELDWGNVDSIIALTKLIAYRKGFGQILAEGVRDAANIIGKGAPDYAMHVKGLGITPEEVKTCQGWALSYAVNVRGGDHLKGSPMYEKHRVGREIARNIFGTDEPGNMWSPIAKGRSVWWQENHKALIDSLGMCVFLPRTISLLGKREEPFDTFYQRFFDPLYQLFVNATGSKMHFNDFLRCSERIVQIQRAYNAREGITRKDDTLPKRMLTEGAPSAPGKGVTAQLEHLGMLPEYYSFRGCDQGGLPTRQRLLEVGLPDVVNELSARGKLSMSKDRTEDFTEITKYLREA